MKLGALGQWHAWVLITMHDEKRRVIRSDMVDPAGILSEFWNFANRGAQQFGAVGFGDILRSATIAHIVRGHGQQLRRAKPIANRLDAT